jgi:hypothetical protein
VKIKYVSDLVGNHVRRIVWLLLVPSRFLVCLLLWFGCTDTELISWALTVKILFRSLKFVVVGLSLKHVKHYGNIWFVPLDA